MGSVSFQYTGDQDVLRHLDLAQKRVRDSVSAASLEVVEEFLDNVSSKLPEDTGRYKRSGFSDVADVAGGDAGAIGGFAVPYAWYVEQLHPNNPFVITRTWVQETARLNEAFAAKTRANIRDDKGLAQTAKRYPSEADVQFDPPLGVRGTKR